MIRRLNDLCRSVWRLYIIGILDAVINALKLLVNEQEWVNWLVHLLISGFEVRDHDFYVPIKQMTKEITAHDSEETGVIVLQFFEVCVFSGVDDLIIECLVHCSHIFVDSPSFIMLKLKFISVGHVIIRWHHGVYY